MKKIASSNENEMILEFLRGELSSKRFNSSLEEVLKKNNLSRNIIINGLLNVEQNRLRKKIMKQFRGYPDTELFENFPKINRWDFVQFDKEDIDNIFYIDYDYWNELSNGTSKPIDAAININRGIEIYDVSNKPYIEGAQNLKNAIFPPVILITCNEKKYLIIEGHSRMTVYGLKPEYFSGTYGYIGYCSKEAMKNYDSRMIESTEKTF